MNLPSSQLTQDISLVNGYCDSKDHRCRVFFDYSWPAGITLSGVHPQYLNLHLFAHHCSTDMPRRHPVLKKESDIPGQLVKKIACRSPKSQYRNQRIIYHDYIVVLFRTMFACCPWYLLLTTSRHPPPFISLTSHMIWMTWMTNEETENRKSTTTSKRQKEGIHTTLGIR